VPGSSAYFSARWSRDGRTLAALSLDSTRLALFDFSTGKWSDLATGSFFAFPCWSHDGRYIYYLQGTRDPAVMRVRLSDRKVERMAGMGSFPVAGYYGDSLSLAPDDQPIVMRDLGAMEIFALDFEALHRLLDRPGAGR